MVTSTNVLLSAYTSFLHDEIQEMNRDLYRVNALPGLYLISTRTELCNFRSARRSVNALPGLYLISTHDQYEPLFRVMSVSMPSRAYTSFLRLLLAHIMIEKCYVSMPSRAYTSFLRYPFKNLGFMRFPEPVFADIYQNILTAAVFRAC